MPSWKVLIKVGMQPATALPTSRYLSLCDRLDCLDLLDLASLKDRRVLVLHKSHATPMCDGKRSLMKGGRGTWRLWMARDHGVAPKDAAMQAN